MSRICPEELADRLAIMDVLNRYARAGRSIISAIC